MGDDECRREDAREEAAIEQCLRNGTMILCHICDYPTTPYFARSDEDREEPLCRRCAERRDEEE